MGPNGTKLMGPKRVKKWSKWDKKESKADQMEPIRNKMAERVLSTRNQQGTKWNKMGQKM